MSLDLTPPSTPAAAGAQRCRPLRTLASGGGGWPAGRALLPGLKCAVLRGHLHRRTAAVLPIRQAVYLALGTCLFCVLECATVVGTHVCWAMVITWRAQRDLIHSHPCCHPLPLPAPPQSASACCWLSPWPRLCGPCYPSQPAAAAVAAVAATTVLCPPERSAAGQSAQRCCWPAYWASMQCARWCATTTGGMRSGCSEQHRRQAAAGCPGFSIGVEGVWEWARHGRVERQAACRSAKCSSRVQRAQWSSAALCLPQSAPQHAPSRSTRP